MLQFNEARQNRSWIEETRARFAALNETQLGPTQALLEQVVNDSTAHARLTNTLSLLEHIGSHKIMATQHSMAIELATLRHLAEEAHHALFMRRQAEKMAGRALAYVPSDTLAPAAARMYFKRLEARILSRLRREGSVAATYLYVSMIIEFRALWFYGLYSQTLRAASHAMSLKRILGEEAHHLEEMAQRLESARALEVRRVADFMTVEHALYGRLLAAIQRDLAERHE